MYFTVDGFMYKEQKMFHLLFMIVIYMNKDSTNINTCLHLPVWLISNTTLNRTHWMFTRSVLTTVNV